MPVLSPLLTIMTRAAEKAAKSLLRDFGEVEQLQVSVKGPGDFVSAADRRAEQIIHSELAKSRPGFAFLMEESGAVGAKDAEARWIIDPLDGTNNFLHGIPHWAISIALEKDGDIIAGVIHDPVKNEMFYAEKGSGAFMSDRRIRVSGRRELDRTMVGHWMPLTSRLDDKTYNSTMNTLRSRVAGVRCSGSAALDMAYVSAGRFDAYFQQNLQIWDIAAGVILIREAGGKVQGYGNGTDPLTAGGILATNQFMLQPMQDMLGIK
jgi:myo-inositol-1(or 4)-monophosphatase